MSDPTCRVPKRATRIPNVHRYLGRDRPHEPRPSSIFTKSSLHIAVPGCFVVYAPSTPSCHTSNATHTRDKSTADINTPDSGS